MGRKVSEGDQEKMRRSLGIEPGGKVVFQEFADLVKDMFKFKLSMSMMEPMLLGGIERKDSMKMPPLKVQFEHLQSNISLIILSQVSSTDFHLQKEDSPIHSSYMDSKDQEAELERMRQRLHQEGQRREEEERLQQEAFIRMQVLYSTQPSYMFQNVTIGCLTREGAILQTA